MQTGAVLDVYAGLLVGLARADWPADGRVRVGRTVFLRRLRWCGQDGRVSGRAYQQLDAALAHLMGMAIRSSAIEHVIEADPGSAGELTFRILQAYGRVSDSGPDGDDGAARPDAGHRADDLVVYFTTPFVRSLRGTERRVTYRLSHYLDFGQGAPRALYRYVCYLATQPLVNGSVEVSVDELLASVGSHLRGVPPAKVRQLCGQAFDQMVNRGILRRPPVYRRVRGGPNPRYVVEIRPGAPPTPALEALLYEALVAYGVQTSMAHRLVMPTRTGSPSWSRPPRSV